MIVFVHNVFIVHVVIKGSHIVTVAIIMSTLAGVKKFLHGWKQIPTPTHSQPATVPEVGPPDREQCTTKESQNKRCHTI